MYKNALFLITAAVALSVASFADPVAYLDTNGAQQRVDPTHPLPVTGSITATNPSVGTNNATAPTSSTQIGIQDSSGLVQPASVSNPVPITGTVVQGASGDEPWLVNVGYTRVHAQAVTIAASSHANNTCLGAIHSFTLGEFKVGGAGLLQSLSVRTANGLTGTVSVNFFTAAPSATVCPTDGAAFAATDADLLLMPAGGAQTVTLAAIAGGLTQSSGAALQLALPIRVDSNWRLWVAIVNTSGAAMTPTANGISEVIGTLSDPN